MQSRCRDPALPSDSLVRRGKRSRDAMMYMQCFGEKDGYTMFG